MLPARYHAHMDASSPPPLDGILETVLYADDLEAERDFFTSLFGFEVVSYDPDRDVFFRCGRGLLLIFKPDKTSSVQVHVGGSPIPRHGARGPGHMAFLAHDDDLDAWRARIVELGIGIESEIDWPGESGHEKPGPTPGRSIYFRDPAGNSIEIATHGLWGVPPLER